MKKGVPVSPGVTVARAFCMLEVLVKREPYLLEPDSIAAEISRLDQACTQAMEELDKIVERVSTQVGEDEAAIFRAHRLLLRDPSLITKVKNIIRTHQLDAASALRETLDEYGSMLSKIPDAYLRDRMTDIRDVVSRIATHLSVVAADYPFDPSEPIILVAAESYLHRPRPSIATRWPGSLPKPGARPAMPPSSPARWASRRSPEFAECCARSIRATCWCSTAAKATSL